MAHILLAEDDSSVRGFLKLSLERAGHQVVDVPDGEAAFNALLNENYDLLLADVVMPGMDGVELARRAAAARPNLRVMFITGFAAVALRAGKFQGKANAVLSKPFHLRDLVDEIERLLAA